MINITAAEVSRFMQVEITYSQYKKVITIISSNANAKYAKYTLTGSVPMQVGHQTFCGFALM